ncbi:hypothetical protein VIGAN_08134200 [Vigna angularis var. angularis]|uniref:Uncharacterized protein n=1 Tax=Vigna angularis var. angularis TaxID=157739 RepID=A0A0S3SPD4_PHAAN|nr:hypothetical protein VIGAN_08134200 [Vigna angularis var. angularis]
MARCSFLSFSFPRPGFCLGFLRGKERRVSRGSSTTFRDERISPSSVFAEKGERVWARDLGVAFAFFSVDWNANWSSFATLGLEFLKL